MYAFVQVCSYAAPPAPPVSQHLWRQLLVAAARLHRPDIGTDILEDMLQQQRQQDCPPPGSRYAVNVLQDTLGSSSNSTGSRAAQGSTAAARGRLLVAAEAVLISDAVKLCLDLGLLHCCPAVSFSLWKSWQDCQQQHKHQRSVLMAVSLSNDALQQLALAAIRAASHQPEAAGMSLYTVQSPS